ncbi:MAG: hypothetical protein GXP32_10125 [Kiritimatiellaeota bacterium]|nr:hypothetical protein [Kiritimatiellota bacterium]
MNESSEKTDNKIAKKVHSLKIKRVVSLAVFGFMMLCMIAVMIICETTKIQFNPLFFLPFIMIGIPVGTYGISSKCPKCGKNFFGMPIRAFYASTCYHCKIGEALDSNGSTDKE